MGVGQSWATPENDPYDGERDLHVLGTRDRGPKGIDFWMFNPPLREGSCRLRCGICKQPMGEERHCKNCYPNKEAL